MTKFVMGALALACLAGAANADIFIQDDQVTLGKSFVIGQASGNGDRAGAGAMYSNIDTFSGFASANGGAQVQSGNTITRLNADDISMLGALNQGAGVTQFSFNVANLNAVAVSARARIRFYAADGSGGGPGTVIAGFSFNPISFTANTVQTYFTTLTAGTLLLPQNFWAGITFDNNTGGTGATLAQMNNLGMGLFNPPAIGTSQDVFFQTTAAGSFLANNPAGSFFNLGGNPVANFGWEFIPTPGAAALFGFAGLAAGRRRR